MKKTLIIIFLLMLPNAGINAGSDIILRFDNPDKMLLMNRLAAQMLFTRKMTRWSDGQEVKIFVKPVNSIEHKEFIRSVLGMTPYNFQRQLESQTYAGRATSVNEVPTDEAMAMKITQTPGSLGYINYGIITSNKIVYIIDGNTVN